MSSALTDRPSGMGELVITTFMTLDGVMQAPGGRDEDREDGFEHGGWQAPVSDPASGDRMYEEFQTWDAYLLGRRTYDIFASFWPNQPDGPFTRLINDLPRYVASRTLRKADWAGHDHPRRRRRRSRSPRSRSATSGSGSGAAPTSSRRCCATTSSTASISGSTRCSSAPASASSRRAPFPPRSAGRR